MNASEVAQLLKKLKTYSLEHMRLALIALQELVNAQCQFESLQEDISGEQSLVSINIKNVSYLNDAQTFLYLAGFIGKLSQAQQSRVVTYLDNAVNVRYLVIHHQFAAEDEDPSEKVKIALLLGAARSSLQRAKDLLSPAALVWLIEHQKQVNELIIADLMLPVIPVNISEPNDLFKACKCLNVISDSLVQPMTLADSVDFRIEQHWLSLWKLCDEAAESLSMVAVWLRCLGNTGEFQRCQICFRHLGEGMKKNCTLHHRTAKVRIPAREQHVSDVYQKTWQEWATYRKGVQALLNGLSPSAETKLLMKKAAEQENLDPDVASAAASLGAFLRVMRPLFGKRLAAAIKDLFEISVTMANSQAIKRRALSKVAIGAMPPVHPSRILSWERFFGSLFGMPLPATLGTSFGIGKPIDLDHPLTSTTQSITVQKLALDLLHLNAWIEVDQTLDVYAYLNSDSVRRVVSTALDEGLSRPTYEELGLIFHAKPQTVQQAIKRNKTVVRRRLLTAGKNELEVRLRSEKL